MPTTTKTKKYIEKIGKRKASSARVRIIPSSKNSFTVNEKDVNSYFITEELQKIVKMPILDAPEDKFEISVKVKGGGIHSQAEAVRHGVSRAIVEYKKELRGILKKKGFLTRDARVKERRKFGLKKARRAPQWSKR